MGEFRDCPATTCSCSRSYSQMRIRTRTRRRRQWSSSSSSSSTVLVVWRRKRLGGAPIAVVVVVGLLLGFLTSNDTYNNNTNHNNDQSRHLHHHQRYPRWMVSSFTAVVVVSVRPTPTLRTWNGPYRLFQREVPPTHTVSAAAAAAATTTRLFSDASGIGDHDCDMDETTGTSTISITSTSTNVKNTSSTTTTSTITNTNSNTNAAWTSLDEAIAVFARRNHFQPPLVCDTTATTTTSATISTQRISAIQTRLVQLGLDFSTTATSPTATGDTTDPLDRQSSSASASASESHTTRISARSRVPGCLSTVHVQTILQKRPLTLPLNYVDDNSNNCGPHNDTTAVSSSSSSSWQVREIRGTADAYLSRGLLASVAAVLHHQPVEAVLSYNNNTFTQAMGLGAVLSIGRTNGLASLLATIQSQIRQCLEEPQQPQPQLDATPAPPPTAVPAATAAPDCRDSVKTMEHPHYTPPRVALLLSGGVDSSVALHLLVRERHAVASPTNATHVVTVAKYNVTAFYLKIWLADELSHLGTCPWEDDYAQCVAVCQQLNVPLEALSLQDDYQSQVLQSTIAQVQSGRTPNPDILCNARIKFGCFYDAAIVQRKFDYIATGHYAQVIRRCPDDTVQLHRAPDPVKDQSYFLCALTQSQLQRVLFPIGHYQKTEVRALADQWTLPNRNRPDSQGLCFLGRIKFNDFLASVLPDEPGPIVDAATGQVVGTHNGIWYHTIGQRKGLGPVLIPTVTSQGPWFIVAKHPPTRTIYCSNQYDQDAYNVPRSEFAVEAIHWIAGRAPLAVSVEETADAYRTFRLTMKIRHGPKLDCGTLTMAHENDTNGEVRLDNKDGGLAPGQYVAFYNDTECLGGGVISEQHWARFLEWGQSTASVPSPITF